MSASQSRRGAPAQDGSAGVDGAHGAAGRGAGLEPRRRVEPGGDALTDQGAGATGPPRSGPLLALLLPLALALAVSLLAQSQMSGDAFTPLIDSEAYLLQALRVAAGADIVEGVYFQAPLYPLVLGATLGLAGVPGSTTAERLGDLPAEDVARAVAVGRGLAVALGLLLVALVTRLAHVLFDRRTAFWAGLLVALHGPTLFYQGHLLKVSLALVFLPWAVLAATRALRVQRPRAWAWVGLALGLGGLVRGNMHLLGGLAGLALLVHGLRTATLPSALRRLAWLGVGAGLALAPVVLRNSLVAGRPVLSTAAGGTAFYLCNHAGNDTGLVEHTALNRQIPRYELDDWRERAETAEGRALSPAEISSYWMGRALDDIAADPGRWLLVELRKLGLLVSRYEAPDNTLVALGEEQSWLLAWTPSRHALLVPLCLGGLALLWQRRRRAATSAGVSHGAGPSGVTGDGDARAAWRRGGRLALLLALAGYAGTLLLFNMTSRFRAPVAPLMAVPAAVLLAGLPSLLAGRVARLPVLLTLAAGVGLTLVSEGPLGPLDERELASHWATRFKNLAQIALDRGDVPAAREDIRRAMEAAASVGQGAPDLFVLAGGLDRAQSVALAAGGQGAEAAALRGRAVQAISQALELNPRHGPAHRMAGLLLYDEGAYRDAVASFDRALAAVPLDREARQYRCLSLLSAGRATEALDDARALVAQQPEHDDGHGLLVLALLGAGRGDEARTALEAYDRLASIREAAGLPRRLPDQPSFAGLRVGESP